MRVRVSCCALSRSSPLQPAVAIAVPELLPRISVRRAPGRSPMGSSSASTETTGPRRRSSTWTAGAPTLQGPIDGPCQIVNHYTAIGMATQCQRLTVTCSDCSIIKRTQCKTWWIRWTHAQNETNPRSVTPCAIPPGYAPPAAPTAAPVPPANFEGPFDETDPVPSASSICP
jgi:hypothetical protein